jgi:CRP-like cAMP-binding protein
MHAPATPPIPRVAEFLGYVPVFQRLTADERRMFAALVREQRVPRGALIVRQGDPGDALYVVRAGQVKVTVIGEDGREVILGTLGATAHFGELALLDGRPRSAHVLAMEATTLYVLRREDFRRQVEQMPRVAWALLEELSRRLREADQKITGLVLLDVPGRVARLLLDRATGEPAVVERAPTHETIAQMIGASRETVSRAMKELQDLGLVRAERRTVHLLDREGLTRRASPGAATRAARAERAAAAERNEAADVGLGASAPGAAFDAAALARADAHPPAEDGVDSGAEDRDTSTE